MVVTVHWSGTVMVSTPRRTGPCMRGSGKGTRWMGGASSPTRQARCTRESLSTISFTARENTLGRTIHFTKDSSTKISKMWFFFNILFQFHWTSPTFVALKINWNSYFYHKYVSDIKCTYMKKIKLIFSRHYERTEKIINIYEKLHATLHLIKNI